nr:hypothetical protein [Tanacetum cinerariifolium]
MSTPTFAKTLNLIAYLAKPTKSEGFKQIIAFLNGSSLGDMSDYNDIYDNPSLTKKVFANMKRVGTGFSRVVTPFLDTMLVPATNEVVDIKSTYKERIEKLEGRVDRLEDENRVLKDLHSVYSIVDTAAPVVEKEKSFKQGRIIANIDEDVEINMEKAQAKLYRKDLEHPKKRYPLTHFTLEQMLNNVRLEVE